MATNPDYKEPVASVLNPIREKEFTRTILECAAIIAYKQPITRSELETVRGVNSDYAVTTLLNLDMIEPCGRKDAPGKPVLYATTDNFLKRFKLKSLAELPDYDELMKKIAELNASSEASSYLYEKTFMIPKKIPKCLRRAERKKNPNLPRTDSSCPIFSKISRTESSRFSNIRNFGSSFRKYLPW